MIRSTYHVTDVYGTTMTAETFENDSRVIISMYDGDTVVANTISEMSLTATAARKFAHDLLKAADKADTA